MTVASLGASVAVSMVPYIPNFPQYKVVAIVWLVSAIAADVLIASTLVIHLVCVSTSSL